MVRVVMEWVLEGADMVVWVSVRLGITRRFSCRRSEMQLYEYEDGVERRTSEVLVFRAGVWREDVLRFPCVEGTQVQVSAY